MNNKIYPTPVEVVGTHKETGQSFRARRDSFFSAKQYIVLCFCSLYCCQPDDLIGKIDFVSTLAGICQCTKM
jgi:hypothetical protein